VCANYDSRQHLPLWGNPCYYDVWDTTCSREQPGGGTVASDVEFVRYVCDQIAGAGLVTYRAMFGEYAVYCDGKVVALVCDDRFFVKPTQAGRAYIGDVVEAPAYPGAKPSFLIEDRLDDRAWLTELVRVTAAELPPPKPKRPRVKKPRQRGGAGCPD
jgi:TfoX/Sxy family transcriptional regulator of competence genes